MVLLEENQVINTYEIEGEFKMDLYLNGVVEINFAEDFYEVKIEHLKEIKEGMKYLGMGKKLPFFFNSKDFLGVDKEAVAYSKSPESGEFTLANAVLVDTQAKRMLYNFYFRIVPPHVQTKAFKSKEDALAWLVSLPKD
ncbi:MAG: hypothetical protein R2799_10010 [Crocinitomicaceae bacterium]